MAPMSATKFDLDLAFRLKSPRHMCLPFPFLILFQLRHYSRPLGLHRPRPLDALHLQFLEKRIIYFCLKHQILPEYESKISEVDREKLKDEVFEDFLKAAQEAIIIPPWVAMAIWPKPRVWVYARVNVTELVVQELSV